MQLCDFHVNSAASCFRLKAILGAMRSTNIRYLTSQMSNIVVLWFHAQVEPRQQPNQPSGHGRPRLDSGETARVVDSIRAYNTDGISPSVRLVRDHCGVPNLTRSIIQRVVRNHPGLTVLTRTPTGSADLAKFLNSISNTALDNPDAIDSDDWNWDGAISADPLQHDLEFSYIDQMPAFAVGFDPLTEEEKKKVNSTFMLHSATRNPDQPAHTRGIIDMSSQAFVPASDFLQQDVGAASRHPT